MLVSLVMVAVLLGAAGGPAASAADIRIPTGGLDIGWSVLRTSSGTYAITMAARKRKVQIRTSRLTAAGPAAGPALTISPDGPLVGSVSEDGSAPCLGTSVKQSPFVACIQDGAWVERRFTGANRTRTLIDIDRFGGSLSAYLLDGDFGAFDGKHPEKVRLSESLVRWDGSAWVPVIPSYVLSLRQFSQPLPCQELLAVICPAPLVVTGSTTSDKFIVRQLSGATWAADARTFAMTKADYTLGSPMGLGATLAVPVGSGRGHRASLSVLTDSSAPKRIRIATITSTYSVAYLTAAAGRPWVSWVDYDYADKKETRGDEVAHVAPLDLVAGTVGPSTEVLNKSFKRYPGRVEVVDVDGAAYAASITSAAADTLVLSPLAAP